MFQKHYLLVSGHELDKLLQDISGQRIFINLEDGFLDLKGSEIQVFQENH